MNPFRLISKKHLVAMLALTVLLSACRMRFECELYCPWTASEKSGEVRESKKGKPVFAKPTLELKPVQASTKLTMSPEFFVSNVAPAGSSSSALVCKSAGDEGVIVSGFVKGSVTFASSSKSPVVLESAGEKQEMYLAEYNKSGRVEWVATIRPSAASRPISIDIAPNGDVYFMGYYLNALAFNGDGDEPVTISGSDKMKNAFVACYDGSGNLKWVRNLRYNDNGRITENMLAFSVTSTPDNGVLVCGEFLEGMTVESSSGAYREIVTHSIEDTGFLIKYDAMGNMRWHRLLEGPTDSGIFNLKVSDSGDIFAAGTYGGTVRVFNTREETVPVSTPTWAGRSWFTAQFDSAGLFKSAKFIDARSAHSVTSGMDFFPDGSYALFGLNQGSLVFKTEESDVVASVKSGQKNFTALARMEPRSNVARWVGVIKGLKHAFGVRPLNYNNVFVDKCGNTHILVYSDGGLEVSTIGDGKTETKRLWPEANKRIFSLLAFSPEGKLIETQNLGLGHEVSFSSISMQPDRRGYFLCGQGKVPVKVKGEVEARNVSFVLDVQVKGSK